MSRSLPKQAGVSIDIFDILGRKIQMLAEEEIPAGEHMVMWDASRQASGNYFYRIRAGNFVEARKMQLLK